MTNPLKNPALNRSTEIILRSLARSSSSLSIAHHLIQDYGSNINHRDAKFMLPILAFAIMSLTAYNSTNGTRWWKENHEEEPQSSALNKSINAILRGMSRGGSLLSLLKLASNTQNFQNQLIMNLAALLIAGVSGLISYQPKSPALTLTSNQKYYFKTTQFSDSILRGVARTASASSLLDIIQSLTGWQNAAVKYSLLPVVGILATLTSFKQTVLWQKYDSEPDREVIVSKKIQSIDAGLRGMARAMSWLNLFFVLNTLLIPDESAPSKKAAVESAVMMAGILFLLGSYISYQRTQTRMNYIERMSFPVLIQEGINEQTPLLIPVHSINQNQPHNAIPITISESLSEPSSAAQVRAEINETAVENTPTRSEFAGVFSDKRWSDAATDSAQTSSVSNPPCP